MIHLTLAAEKISGHNGMLFACWSIIIVIGITFFSFLRGGRREYAVAVLPLLITPFTYVVSGIVSSFIPLGVEPEQLRILLMVGGALLSCLLLGHSSRKIDDAKARNTFFWICAVFVLILSLVLIGRMVVYTHIKP